MIIIILLQYTLTALHDNICERVNNFSEIKGHIYSGHKVLYSVSFLDIVIVQAEEKKLEAAEKYLEESATMFDEFLKENDKNAVEAIKMYVPSKTQMRFSSSPPLCPSNGVKCLL